MEALIRIIQDKDYSTFCIDNGTIKIFVDDDWSQIYEIEYVRYDDPHESKGGYDTPTIVDIETIILVEKVILIKQCCEEKKENIPFSEKLGEILLFEFDKRL